MKYILIKTEKMGLKYDAYFWNRCVVGLKKEFLSANNTPFYKVIALCDGVHKDTPAYKTWAVRGQTFNVATNRTIEVTEIYNKINKLLGKMVTLRWTLDDNKNYNYINKIKTNFKCGKYPTVFQFKKMNKLWKEYK